MSVDYVCIRRTCRGGGAVDVNDAMMFCRLDCDVWMLTSVSQDSPERGL